MEKNLASLNEAPSGERVHIGFFGMRNAGKSSLMNAVANQKIAVVSPVKGTTTDPVKKAMELLPLGPVVLIDTPGIDDEGELGSLRVERAKQAMSGVDVAVLTVDTSVGLGDEDRALLAVFRERNIPYVIAYNKSDLVVESVAVEDGIAVSALTGEGIDALRAKIAALGSAGRVEKHVAADLVKPGDCAVLVIPIDDAAPKGRLILPQQQVIRDLLEAGAAVVCVRDTELTGALNSLSEKPAVVITDSQAFARVSKLVPEDVPLTSFSILFARYKGELGALVRGAEALRSLGDGDRVLIAEGCSHRRQCGDIGTVKLPMWIRNYSHAEPSFSFTSGGEFPDDLSEYSVVVHCGGCMLNEREMKSRMARCAEAGVPMVNYGVAIAEMNGILSRALKPVLND